MDKFLWKGSPDATMVQRAGIAIFAVFFLVAGYFFGHLAVEIAQEGELSATILMSLFALFWITIGCKLLANAFRTSARKNP